MKPLILTKTDGAKQLVNMDLVSEALRAQEGSVSFTNLVVPSAAYEDAKYIGVQETPEQILALLNA